MEDGVAVWITPDVVLPLADVVSVTVPVGCAVLVVTALAETTAFSTQPAFCPHPIATI